MGKYKLLSSFLQNDQILSPTFKDHWPINALTCDRVTHVASTFFQLSSAPLSLMLWLHVFEATKIVLSSAAAELRHLGESKTKLVMRGLRIGQCFSPNPLALARNDPRRFTHDTVHWFTPKAVFLWNINTLCTPGDVEPCHGNSRALQWWLDMCLTEA